MKATFENSTQSGWAELETYATVSSATNGPDLVSAVTNRVFVPQTPETFAYDADGNLTEDGRFRYWWNGENRMVRAEEKMPPEGRTAHVVVYAYDHQGRNVVKDGSLQIWDDYNIVIENAAVSNVVINVWGLDIDGTMQGAGGVGGLLAVARSGATSLPLYDANGNITEYVDSLGGVESHTDYSAFGRELMRNGRWNYSHGFSTKPWCRKSGLVAYQMRKYMPWQGRWTRRDDVESSHPYIYLSNECPFYYDYLGMYGNPVMGPGGKYMGPSNPYDPGGPYGPHYIPWYESLPDCPCSIPIDDVTGCPQKNGAGEGWDSPQETGHAGGSWEIRSKPTASGAGQQCVYDSAGNLINRGSGAGTPDIISPSSFWIGHVLCDALPYYWNRVWRGAKKAEEFDHKFHPPNQGRDSNGNPCPPNDGSNNPPRCKDGCSK